MKNILIAGLIVTAGLLSGCNQGTPGGTPAVQQQTANKPVIGEAKDTFTLSVPTLTTSLKQGETKPVTIGIRRGTNFGADVALSFSGMPAGVTITPNEMTIKHGEAEASATIAAASDAALGDFKIKVTGHPSQGTADAMNEFNLKIAESK